MNYLHIIDLNCDVGIMKQCQETVIVTNLFLCVYTQQNSSNGCNPAVNAGVHVHDLILSCDGCHMSSFQDLANSVNGKSQVTLRVFRGFNFDTPDE